MKTLPKLHKICSNDDLRYSLQLIQFKNGIATATDAHILVRYNLNGILNDDVLKVLEGKCLHANTWKFICAQKTLLLMANDDDTLALHVGDIGMMKIKPIENKYVDWDKILPDAIKLADSEPLNHIGINPILLQKVSDVLTHGAESKSVVLRIHKKTKSMLVFSESNYKESVGMIMPVTFADELKDEMFTKFL